MQEAIDNQKQGKFIKLRKKSLIIPTELATALTSDTLLADSFEELTLTNKRDYAEYITDAKRADTKQKRLGRIIPMILAGIGLNDKYKK